TGRYDEFEAFVVGLLADNALDERLAIVTRALRVANFIALDEEERAFRSLASLVAELSRYQSSDFQTEWTFLGALEYIGKNERTFGTHRGWINEFLFTLQAERGVGLINSIRAMR
ncbi:MAG: hypothetical protein OEY63_02460, partial [Gemmatimonadota bacterium]|nr:hypothetical protein [Gemmatimonadota bacterium]